MTYLIAALCFILLFAVTKDRWNWKKIIIRTIVVVIIAGSVVCIYCYISNLAHVQDSISNINLGTSKSDIRFLLGEPSEINNQESDAEWVAACAEYDKSVDKEVAKALNISILEEAKFTEEILKKKGTLCNEWVYPDNCTISFRGNQISYIVNENEFNDIQGIHIQYSSSEDIIKKFGKPSRIVKSGEGLIRTYFYNKYHVFFVLSKNEVKVFGVFNPNNIDKHLHFFEVPKADGTTAFIGSIKGE